MWRAFTRTEFIEIYTTIISMDSFEFAGHMNRENIENIHTPRTLVLMLSGRLGTEPELCRQTLKSDITRGMENEKRMS
jgi:hypothetical protein